MRNYGFFPSPRFAASWPCFLISQQLLYETLVSVPHLLHNAQLNFKLLDSLSIFAKFAHFVLVVVYLFLQLLVLGVVLLHLGWATLI